MRVLLFALASWTMFAAAPAFSQDIYSIGHMRSACELGWKKDSVSHSKEFYECVGWLKAQNAWRLAMCTALLKDENPGIVAEITARNSYGHSNEALVQAFLNWADSNPELWSKNLVYTTFDLTFWAEFPCESKSN